MISIPLTVICRLVKNINEIGVIVIEMCQINILCVLDFRECVLTQVVLKTENNTRARTCKYQSLLVYYLIKFE